MTRELNLKVYKCPYELGEYIQKTDKFMLSLNLSDEKLKLVRAEIDQFSIGLQNCGLGSSFSWFNSSHIGAINNFAFRALPEEELRAVCCTRSSFSFTSTSCDGFRE